MFILAIHIHVFRTGRLTIIRRAFHQAVVHAVVAAIAVENQWLATGFIGASAGLLIPAKSGDTVVIDGGRAGIVVYILPVRVGDGGNGIAPVIAVDLLAVDTVIGVAGVVVFPTNPHFVGDAAVGATGDIGRFGKRLGCVRFGVDIVDAARDKEQY